MSTEPLNNAPTSAASAEFQRSATSMRGRHADFGPDAAGEVERVLRVQKNYYAVLKVRKDTPPAEIRANYFRLSRLIHPDKCNHPQAAEASAVANQANDTLRSAIKKTLYDQYVDDVDTDAPEGMSYADWEASHAANIQLPAWMERLLQYPGAGICLLLILFPLTLLLLLLALVLSILCLPLRILVSCCCRPQAPQEHTAATGSGAAEQIIIDMPEAWDGSSGPSMATSTKTQAPLQSPAYGDQPVQAPVVAEVAGHGQHSTAQRDVEAAVPLASAGSQAPILLSNA